MSSESREREEALDTKFFKFGILQTHSGEMYLKVDFPPLIKTKKQELTLILGTKTLYASGKVLSLKCNHVTTYSKKDCGVTVSSYGTVCKNLQYSQNQL